MQNNTDDIKEHTTSVGGLTCDHITRALSAGTGKGVNMFLLQEEGRKLGPDEEKQMEHSAKVIDFVRGRAVEEEEKAVEDTGAGLQGFSWQQELSKEKDEKEESHKEDEESSSEEGITTEEMKKLVESQMKEEEKMRSEDESSSEGDKEEQKMR